MKATDSIRISLETSKILLDMLIDDMKDAPLTSPTPQGGNHPLWVIGHLAYSEGSLLQETMLGESNPLAEWKEMFSNGTEPVNDADTYPSYDLVLAKLQEVHQANMSLLDSMSEDDLDTPSKACPPEHKGFFGTYRQCFQQIANHWWMHQGQVADARRADGRKPIMA